MQLVLGFLSTTSENKPCFSFPANFEKCFIIIIIIAWDQKYLLRSYFLPKDKILGSSLGPPNLRSCLDPSLFFQETYTGKQIYISEKASEKKKKKRALLLLQPFFPQHVFTQKPCGLDFTLTHASFVEDEGPFVMRQPRRRL